MTWTWSWRDHVAERRDVELVAGDFGAERRAGERDLLDQPRALVFGKVEKLDESARRGTSEEPRIVRVDGQPHRAKRQRRDRDAVGRKLRIEDEIRHRHEGADWLTVRRARPKVRAHSPGASMTDIAKLRSVVESAFEARDQISVSTAGEVREAVESALDLLDSGKLRVAEKKDGAWVVNEWLKKAVLLSFRLNEMAVIRGGPGMPTGGTRCRRNSPAGARIASALRASAPCRARSSAAPPTSRRASC